MFYKTFASAPIVASVRTQLQNAENINDMIF